MTILNLVSKNLFIHKIQSGSKAEKKENAREYLDNEARIVARPALSQF